jgi:hypothetical protein
MTQPSDNQSIAPENRHAVEELDRFAALPEVARALKQASAEAHAMLHRDPRSAEAFAPLDLTSFACPVPAAVGSARVVVTRGRGGARLERHANSTQYLFAIDGVVETRVQTADGWRVDRYGLGDSALLENRWHVVPAGRWHQSSTPEPRTWGIAAFHSARDVSDEYQ